MTDATAGDGDADGRTCHRCGESVDESSQQRVVTAVENGQAAYLCFCGDACLAEWRSAGGLGEWRGSE